MKDGQRNGKGIFIWSTEDSKGHRYQGEWKDDKMRGKGLYIYILMVKNIMVIGLKEICMEKEL